MEPYNNNHRSINTMLLRSKHMLRAYYKLTLDRGETSHGCESRAKLAKATNGWWQFRMHAS